MKRKARMGARLNNEGPPIPQAEPLRVIYFDDDLLVLDKPAGVHVFPLKDGEEAVLNYLIKQWPELAKVGDPRFPAIAHRLDQGTSGLLLVARTQNAYQSLRTMFRHGLVRKFYLALVEGKLIQFCKVEIPIGGRHRRSQKVSVAAHESDRRKLHSHRPAMTLVCPLGNSRNFSLCRIEMATGVRHQIRAHLSHIGHPIAGDIIYGATQSLPEITGRFFLHAWRLELAHPIGNQELSFVCSLPKNLNSIIDRLGIPRPE